MKDRQVELWKGREVYIMELLFKNHVPIANKWLIVFSGINKSATKNGKKQYEQHAFHIPKEWISIKWTRSLINQTLCYLGLTDSKGVLGVVSTEDIAAKINCSSRTVKENNKQLVELGLIEVDNLWGEYLNIRFSKYKEDFLDLYPSNKEEDKGQALDVLAEDERDIPHRSRTGYTMIKRESLFELFEINNVNELKIACRALYIYEKEVNMAGKETAYITYSDLKGILPKYYAYKAQIKKGFSSLRKLFTYNPLEKEQVINDLLANQKVTPSILEKAKNTFMIGFKLLKEKDSRYIHNKEMDVAYDCFSQFCVDTQIKMIPPYQQSSLVREFGLIAVKDGIAEIMDLFDQSYSEARNAMIDGIDHEPIQTLRKFIKKHYEGKISVC